MNKKELAITLSKLEVLKDFDVNLEQYQTEGELASDILWKANINEDIKDKIIADFGCGNGILGIGALLLGSKKVFFIDIDKKAIEIAKNNYKKLKLKNGFFLNQDIEEFNSKVDTVLMNPPFGVQKEHSDRIFLKKASESSKNIYSIHKIESKKFIENFCKNNDLFIRNIYKYKFLIKKTYKFHTKKSYFVEVGCWYLKNELK